MKTPATHHSVRRRSQAGLLSGGSLFVGGIAALVASGIVVGVHDDTVVVVEPAPPPRQPTFVSVPQPAPQPVIVHSDAEDGAAQPTDDELTWQQLGLEPRSLPEMMADASLTSTLENASSAESPAQQDAFSPATPAAPATLATPATATSAATAAEPVTTASTAQAAAPDDVAEVDAAKPTSESPSEVPGAADAATATAGSETTEAPSGAPRISIVHAPIYPVAPSGDRAATRASDGRTVPGTVPTGRFPSVGSPASLVGTRNTTAIQPPDSSGLVGGSRPVAPTPPSGNR